MTADDWHTWRNGGWGASDMAAAWTGRYGGAYRKVAEKAGRLTDDAPDEATQDRMDRGKDLEPTLAALVELTTGWFVVTERMAGDDLWMEHRTNPRHRATLDGLAVHDLALPLTDAVAVVEFKTHGTETRPAWDYFHAQVQWQLHVTGMDTAVLAVAAVDDLTGRIENLRLTTVDADLLLQASLVALADEMDAHLHAGTLPDPDGSDMATAAVKALTWTATPDDVMAVDLSDLEDRVARLGTVKEALAAAKAELAETENMVKDRMGYAAHGVAGEWRVTYGKARRVLDEDRVLADHPEFAKTVLDRKAAEAALGKGLDDYRDPLGARPLTVRRAKEATE